MSQSATKVVLGLDYPQIGRVFCKSTFEEAVQILMSEMYLDPKAPPGMIEYRRCVRVFVFVSMHACMCLYICT